MISLEIRKMWRRIKIGWGSGYVHTPALADAICDTRRLFLFLWGKRDGFDVSFGGMRVRVCEIFGGLNFEREKRKLKKIRVFQSNLNFH